MRIMWTNGIIVLLLVRGLHCLNCSISRPQLPVPPILASTQLYHALVTLNFSNIQEVITPYCLYCFYKTSCSLQYQNQIYGWFASEHSWSLAWGQTGINIRGNGSYSNNKSINCFKILHEAPLSKLAGFSRGVKSTEMKTERFVWLKSNMGSN